MSANVKNTSEKSMQ